MTEISTNTVEEQLRLPRPEDVHVAGAIALAETIDSDIRTIIVGSQVYETDLPAGIDIFEEPHSFKKPLHEALSPSALDELPVGIFHFSGETTEIDESFQNVTRSIEREIQVIETDKGKVIGVESFGKNADWRMQPDTGKLMSALGYVIDGEAGRARIIAVPTPETVKKAAQDIGVEIEFFPKDGYIPGSQYLQTYVDGKYPVAMGEASFYQHDIEDDHLTAMALGGVHLRDALKSASETALLKDEKTIDHVAQTIDSYTASLRAVVSSHSELLGEAYGDARGRTTLIDIGEEIGITAEATNAVIAEAQENGREYGLDVKNLQ